jgi:LCP family protein required for cell wall assembly
MARGDAPRTDTIIVASVSADRQEITLISVPRDTVDVPMPDGSVWSQKINALYALHGVDAIRGAVETLLDISIDHYVLLDMDGFARLTDALGGVEVNVPFSMQDPKVRLSIPAGPQLMSGELALKYARSRSLDGDYGRAARQQEMVLALARAIADPARVVDPIAVLEAVSSFKTDLDLADLSGALDVVRASGAATITKMVLKPPRFALFAGIAGTRGWVMIPNVAEMRAFAAEALAD